MTTFKPIDGSKEDFRKYLDRKGVLDAITKVLIKCNADRPDDAIEFILENLGEKAKDRDAIARLETELTDARHEIDVLKREITALKVTKIEPEQQPSKPAETELPVTNSSPPEAVIAPAIVQEDEEPMVVAEEEPPKVEEPPSAATNSIEEPKQTSADGGEEAKEPPPQTTTNGSE